MRKIIQIVLTVFISFGILGGCGGGDDSWIGPISFTSWPEEPKCANNERRCHGICYLKSLDCPEEGTTNTEIYIQSQSCYKTTTNTLEFIVRGVASGPIGTEITFEFGNPVRRLYESISCIIRWEEGHSQGLNLDYCIRTELSDNPVTSWLVRSSGHTDTFSQYEDVTVYINGKSVRTTVNCPDATGDIPREDCFTFYEVSMSECPSEKVLDVCGRYGCLNTGSSFLPFFPNDFIGCRVKDCNTIDCDQTKNIHIDGLLSWIENVDGEEIEANCYPFPF